jgi:hypothetical protein
MEKTGASISQLASLLKELTGVVGELGNGLSRTKDIFLELPRKRGAFESMEENQDGDYQPVDSKRCKQQEARMAREE